MIFLACPMWRGDAECKKRLNSPVLYLQSAYQGSG
jgi:hypothetical protein